MSLARPMIIINNACGEQSATEKLSVCDAMLSNSTMTERYGLRRYARVSETTTARGRGLYNTAGRGYVQLRHLGYIRKKIIGTRVDVPVCIYCCGSELGVTSDDPSPVLAFIRARKTWRLGQSPTG